MLRLVRTIHVKFLKERKFETVAFFNFMGHAIYSVSHKVEISERFKSHRLEFKRQSSNLKNLEKIDE